MANGGQRRTRSERVAALELPPGRWERAWTGACNREVLARAGLSLLAATIVCCAIGAWDPPIHWRAGMQPVRYVTARVPFKQENSKATELARQRARDEAKAVFAQDAKPLVRLRADLRTTIADLTKAETLNESTRLLWKDFQPQPSKGATPPKPQDEEPQFLEFRNALGGQEKLDRLDRTLADAFASLEQHGLLASPTKTLKGPQGQGHNLEFITVYPAGSPANRQEVPVGDVILDKDKTEAIRQKLAEQLHSRDIADRVFAWLEPKLLHSDPALTTLTLDNAATKKAQDQAEAEVVPVEFSYEPGTTLAVLGESIDDAKLELLAREYRAFLGKRTLVERLIRCGSVLLIVFAAFMVCGMYTFYRQPIADAAIKSFAVTLVMAVGTVTLALWVSGDPWRAESVPVVLFGMIMAIAHSRQLALLFTGVVCWIVVISLGYELALFLLLFGTTAVASLNMGRIRTRSKLVYVGLLAGSVALLLDLALSMTASQNIGMSLLRNAGRQGLWAVAAGFIMTGLLPFIERAFGMLTDLSLLEMGDITHPLLQELVRRAPSTYNHSITVGSIAEAAADAIGARGLLCRVGAYFHDIGKMLKPGYFVENQGKEGSRHDGLAPAMSTLVIIAHIKDGADLARQHHLPQPIIDLIEQHHGTMLMEYFFDRAHTQQAADPNGSEVDESLFRYPGPKPQTKEAAVLMLSDAVESASRTLVDPTPARIEGLVGSLAQRRLEGGQFDESGLTLRELGTIERSLAMSVASIYHGRIKYPEPRSA